jgi:hypothetical protein
MILWIKSLWETKETNDSPRSIIQDTTPLTTPINPLVQTDIRQYRQIKRLRKSLNDQLKKAEEKALTPHDPLCKDVITCTKVNCFKRVPDKIVSKPYEIKRKQSV